MTDRELVEDEILALLRTETRTTLLSNKLFGQHTGLFCRLATDQEGRRAVSQSELFKQAQARVHELGRRDADALRKAVAIVQENLPDTEFRLRLETATAHG